MKNPKNLNKGMSIEVREIVFSNSEEEKSFCDVFVYEPENIGEQLLGNLYIIGEITNVSENSSYLVNLLASIIKKEFYSNVKRTAIESLEAGLHKANSTLSDIAEQGNIDWVGNLNMICAVYSEDELHLSQAGNCKTLLIRNGQITDVGKNITKKEKTHPFRTFANIASGELEIGDIALFATPGFFNIFSLEKLRKLSSLFGLDEFVEKLQNSVEQEKDLDTVGSLIMKIKDSEQKEDRLSHTEIESAAEKIDEKEIAPIFQERLEETDEKIKKWAEKKTEKESVDIFEKEADADISVSESRVSLESIIKEYEEIEEKADTSKETEGEKANADAMEIINTEQNKEEGVSLDDLIEKNSYSEKRTEKEKSKKSILDGLLKVLNSVFSFIKVKVATPIVNRIKKVDSDTSREVPTEVEEKSSWRAKLIPVKNKYLLIVFVFVATILVWNVISTDYQKRIDDKVEKYIEKYNSTLSYAENKINEADSIIIYGDFKTARELLADAKISALGIKNTYEEMDDRLEIKNKYEKLNDRTDALLKRIQVQFDRVDLVNRIDNPKVAVDLSQTEGLESVGEIIKIGKEYYAFDLSNNSLYQADFENNKADPIQAKIGNDLGQFKFSTAISKTGEIIFLTDSNKIAVFNTNKKELVAKDIKFSNSISSAKDIASYSSYLYLLKPDSNQIYKHTRLANGFGEGKIWIEDPEADIRNAISLAIDGSIYVLKSDGSIDKYLRGSKFKSDDNSDFSIEKLGDPISNPTEIYTRSDLDYLYIVEPQKNRIVLFDKISGKLIKQYVSESFSDLKNIAVDEKEEKIYILSGDKVFEVEIEE